ncbi:unnamed protein product, partial [Ectocarpus sp. 13 AM-2016]
GLELGTIYRTYSSLPDSTIWPRRASDRSCALRHAQLSEAEEEVERVFEDNGSKESRKALL